MSDEAHIQSAHQHRDPVRWQPWQGKSPDEEAMEREEAEFVEAVASAADEARKRRADVQEALFCYLFSGGAEDWRAVALRSIAVMRRMSPGLLVIRKLTDEMRDAVADYSQPGSGVVRFDLGNLERLVNGDARHGLLAMLWSHRRPKFRSPFHKSEFHRSPDCHQGNERREGERHILGSR